MEITVVSVLTPESCEVVMVNEGLDPKQVVYLPPGRDTRMDIILKIVASELKVVRHIGVFTLEELQTLGVM